MSILVPFCLSNESDWSTRFLSTLKSDKERFRLSFAGATVHDMFNWLTVFVMLPVEMSFGYLEHVTGYLVSSLKASRQSGKEPEMLNVIIKPVTNAIIQIDKHVLDKIATNLSIDEPLIKRYCGSYKSGLVFENGTMDNSTHFTPCKSKERISRLSHSS